MLLCFLLKIKVCNTFKAVSSIVKHYLRVKFRSGYLSTLFKAFGILKRVFLRSFLNFDILIVVKVSDLAIGFIQLFHILTLDFYVLYGVPQGSCLGLLLNFLTYTNDLCNVSKSEEFMFFADDTNMFVKAKSKLKQSI